MPDIEIISVPITRERLQEIASHLFGDMVKGVVDLEKKIVALGAELHADAEALLLDQGSQQSDLWGINLYPGMVMPEALEFDSMINIRPAQHNRSRSVEDEAIRAQIIAIVRVLIPDMFQ